MSPSPPFAMPLCLNALTILILSSNVLLVCVSAIQDYCSENTFVANQLHQVNGTPDNNNSNNYMEFTKEASVEEFAILGTFKGLHCCAKGYRSIEWYKDGKPYPWPYTHSRMILYPESANQTVYTNRVTEMDAGNYTCVLRNTSVVHEHTIQLKVFETNPDDPKITFISPDTDLPIGHSLRLFCEAFAGSVVDLPDAHNEVEWIKRGEDINGTILNSLLASSRVRQQKTSRENGQTFGTYLIIDAVNDQDFGEYVCRISKPGKSIEHQVLVRKSDISTADQTGVPILWIWLLVSLFVIIYGLIMIVYFCYCTRIRVSFKDRFGSLEEDDGRINDVLVVYSEKDTEFVRGVLLDVLQNNYGYSCTSCTVTNACAGTWNSNLIVDAQSCRRVLAVLSPAMFNDRWDVNVVLQAVSNLSEMISVPLICVSLVDRQMSSYKTNPLDLNNAGTLSSIRSQRFTLGCNSALKCKPRSSVHIIYWTESRRILRNDNFWLQLRLRLPPMRSRPSSGFSRLITTKSSSHASRSADRHILV